MSPKERPAPPVAGLVLAGGMSRRMGGGDKALRILAGETLLSRVIARARPQLRALVLNANGDPARFSAFGLPVVPDAVPGFAGRQLHRRLLRPQLAVVGEFATPRAAHQRRQCARPYRWEALVKAAAVGREHVRRAGDRRTIRELRVPP